ncbi:MAG TPA: YMGG-like glycine zipper-containing protein [Gemmatimonadaceae bacterium]
MKAISRFAVLSLVLVAFGCKGKDSTQANDALNSDLSLASQAHPLTPAESVSAIERARTNSMAAQNGSGVTHRTVVHHVYEGSNGSSASAAQAAPATQTVRNTNRDAAIGAGAGAILGAVTSKNKLKGGILGGVVGGILGGVVGNNVDTKKVRKP